VTAALRLRAGPLALDVADGEVVAVVGERVVLADLVPAAPEIAVVPEGRHVFGELTVAENLTLGAYRDRRDRAEVARRRERVHALFPRLAARPGQLARTLSGGEQQLLVIARALMAAPRALVLDEPSAGLGPLAVAAVADALSAAGAAVVFAEQGLALARRAADRVVLVADGAVALDAPRDAALEDPRLNAAFGLAGA
jgi:branched-chain amino acid transport system ATP-binding protein